MAVSVLIVDDHPTFRASVRRLLEEEGFDVVGEAADGTSGMAMARELQPQLVLLDVVLPDVSGLEVARGLAAGPSHVLLTSSRARSDFGTQLSSSPAIGFLSKDQLSGEAIRALLERAS